MIEEDHKTESEQESSSSIEEDHKTESEQESSFSIVEDIISMEHSAMLLLIFLPLISSVIVLISKILTYEKLILINTF